jgi:hypothetical protein
MLFRETVAAYCENHMAHADTRVNRKQNFSVPKQVVHMVTIRLYKDIYIKIFKGVGKGELKRDVF